MRTFITAASVLALLIAAPCFAQNAVQALSQPAANASEPNVKYTVIDDDSTHIDELKVRGHTQRITVKPKIAALRGYEIITGDGSRDLSDSANSSRGATGKRVWNVLSF
jgi:hypothetical protein